MTTIKGRDRRRSQPKTKAIGDYARLSRYEQLCADLTHHQTGVPQTRGQCPAERPCANISCKYHLAVDVKPNGSLVRIFPHLEAHEAPESCALDVADVGGHTLEEVGDIMNVSRERIRQIEADAMRKLKPLLRDYGAELSW